MTTKKFLIFFFTLCFLFVLSDTSLIAQCPMCKIAAESNLKNGGTQGKGLNLGILYMLATPYLLIGGIGLFWWKNRKRSAAASGVSADQPG
jgi:hypothetical protein